MITKKWVTMTDEYINSVLVRAGDFLKEGSEESIKEARKLITKLINDRKYLIK